MRSTDSHNRLRRTTGRPRRRLGVEVMDRDLGPRREEQLSLTCRSLCPKHGGGRQGVEGKVECGL